MTDHVSVPTNDRRVLLVHAHPDDESIATGATMARLVAEGAQVVLITCTRGEEGEVLVPDLTHLAAHADDSLGDHRVDELAAAMAQLGVVDHRFLGGAGRFRDSGMMGTPSNDRSDAFWRADLLAAADLLVPVIREVRPQVLITYDQFGAYGHPDHIQAHRVATYATSLAAVPTYRPDLGPPWDISKVYWTALPRSFIQQGIDALVAAGANAFFGLDSVDDLPWANDDAEVTTRIDARAYEASKLNALRAHVTQIEPDNDFFRVAELAGPEALGYEFFRLAKGRLGPIGESGFEEDLFAGLS
jgi:N-acetyl-1-D-myo-inositol-2-amino-2-deoxy-alpha-D-glucopyranoside deacetylase